MSLEDMVKSLADSTCQMRQDLQRFQQKTRTSIRNLEAQMSQLASSMSNLESGKKKLSSQVIPNPKENANAMILRNGKEVQSSKSEAAGEEDERVYGEFEKEKISTPPNFLRTLILTRLFLFLKGLCTNRSKLNVQDKIKIGENVPTALQRKLPQKYKDPSMFTIPCIIGQKRIQRGMLNLGASINIMPLSIFRALNLGLLKDTRVVIQLADKSNVYPERVVEDVLVKVNEFIFPADFYIVDMNDDNSVNSAVLLLGRPFMSTARTKIDVHEGTLSVKFYEQTITFNIFYAMKYLDDTESINYVGVTNSIMQDHLEQNLMEDKLEFVLQ
nr:uncharacterized protein LOC113717107 [Coffea arabica]